MDELRYLSLAYGAFMIFIVLEGVVSYRRNNGYYRIGEMFTNLGHGVVYQTFDLFTKALIMVPFLLVREHASVATLPYTWWGWLAALVAYDFANYWLHRHQHEVNALWAIHASHHAAEDYNLAAALRQPLFQGLIGWFYRLPLAFFMGVEMFVGLVVFDFLYQFVQHTRYVPKLGPVEWLMNTPSHHRVHHGREAKYLDRNYGGILIVWDRLFGTHQVEEEEPSYGVTKPINSVNPVWGNLVFYAELVAATKRASGWRHKLGVWIAGPEDLDRLAPGGAVEARRPIEDADLSRGLKVYVALQALLILPVLPALIYLESTLGIGAKLFVAVYLFAALVSVAGLLEGRARARRVELVRLVISGLGFTWLLVPVSVPLAGASLPAVLPVLAICSACIVAVRMLPRPEASRCAESLPFAPA